MKRENSITFYHVDLMFKSEKNMKASQKSVSFSSYGYILFMDDGSKQKFDDLDNGQVLDPELIGEEENDIVSESDGNATMLNY